MFCLTLHVFFSALSTITVGSYTCQVATDLWCPALCVWQVLRGNTPFKGRLPGPSYRQWWSSGENLKNYSIWNLKYMRLIWRDISVLDNLFGWWFKIPEGSLTAAQHHVSSLMLQKWKTDLDVWLLLTLGLQVLWTFNVVIVALHSGHLRRRWIYHFIYFSKLEKFLSELPVDVSSVGVSWNGQDEVLQNDGVNLSRSSEQACWQIWQEASGVQHDKTKTNLSVWGWNRLLYY